MDARVRKDAQHRAEIQTTRGTASVLPYPEGVEVRRAGPRWDFEREHGLPQRGQVIVVQLVEAPHSVSSASQVPDLPDPSLDTASPQPPILRRRMPPYLGIGRANLPQALPVQIQRRHGGASDGRLAEDRQPIARPREVLVPVIHARMEEPALASGGGIDTALAIPLAAVAREATEREVRRCRFAPRGDRDDVLHGEFDVLPLLRRMAVFSAAPGAPLKAAVALGYVHYNLAHVLRTTPVPPPPAAPAVPGAAAASAPAHDRPLDLFSWKPRTPVQ
jgi:hypothetical protein